MVDVCVWFRFFAGITSILAKCGIKDTDSTVATAIRTIVVLLFAWIMVFVTKTENNFRDPEKRALLLQSFAGWSGIRSTS